MQNIDKAVAGFMKRGGFVHRNFVLRGLNFSKNIFSVWKKATGFFYVFESQGPEKN